MAYQVFTASLLDLSGALDRVLLMMTKVLSDDGFIRFTDFCGFEKEFIKDLSHVYEAFIEMSRAPEKVFIERLEVLGAPPPLLPLRQKQARWAIRFRLKIDAHLHARGVYGYDTTFDVSSQVWSRGRWTTPVVSSYDRATDTQCPPGWAP